MPENKIDIVTLAQAVYKKCECCDRVRDVFFEMNIFDAKTGKMLVGDFDLCKSCGENMSDILNISVDTESTVREFSFGEF
ncbi:MAG TPA: hypothetical protein VK061_10285 [Bacillota bacterium]|nr:hypothetical protein [Bacillota bacterium]